MAPRKRVVFKDPKQRVEYEKKVAAKAAAKKEEEKAAVKAAKARNKEAAKEAAKKDEMDHEFMIQQGRNLLQFAKFIANNTEVIDFGNGDTMSVYPGSGSDSFHYGVVDVAFSWLENALTSANEYFVSMELRNRGIDTPDELSEVMKRVKGISKGTSAPMIYS